MERLFAFNTTLAVMRTRGRRIAANQDDGYEYEPLHKLQVNLTSWINVTGGNVSMSPSSQGTLPREMVFNSDNLVSVVVYTLLFVVAALGNLTVFVTLLRSRNRRSRVNLFIQHLSIADLIVTFVMIPLEVGWHSTVAWKAGDLGCRFFMFCRAFGFYLSSFVLVVITLDRYFAIIHPMRVNDAGKRGRIMLALAWMLSVICSLPQSIIFHVESHPNFPTFTQCVTFNFFPSPVHELAYNLFNLITLYGLPLVIVVTVYLLILWEMTKKTKECKDQVKGQPYVSYHTHRNDQLRRSGIGHMGRARSRTLKMTVVIVMAFITCWTPYFVICIWWWCDRESAKKLDPKIQRGLFIFAVSNSCVNPIVYGLFAMRLSRELRRLCSCLFGRHNKSRKRHRATSRGASANGRHGDHQSHPILRRTCTNSRESSPADNHNTSVTEALELQEQVLMQDVYATRNIVTIVTDPRRGHMSTILSHMGRGSWSGGHRPPVVL